MVQKLMKEIQSYMQQEREKKKYSDFSITNTFVL